jgi:hypothetical protein
MTKRIMASGDAATAPQTRGDLTFKIEDDLAYSIALQDLASWVGLARNYIEDIQSHADSDPKLRALLKQHKFPVNSASWGEQERSGLQYLSMEIGARLLTIRAAAGLSEGATQ